MGTITTIIIIIITIIMYKKAVCSVLLHNGVCVRERERVRETVLGSEERVIKRELDAFGNDLIFI